DRVILEIDDRGRKRRWWENTMRGEIGEDSDHLAGIAPERLAVASVLNPAVPLRAILPGRVPQKRIANRRIGDLVIVANSEVARGDAVEDHPERVKPARSPW